MAQYVQALPAQTAAGATSTTMLGTLQTSNDNEARVVNAALTPPPGFATVTGVNTNNVTFNIRQLRAGTPVATFASVTLNAGTNLVAETPLNVPLTAGITPAAGDVLDVQMVQNGTGLAVGAGVLAQVVLD